ncbi:MAG: GGDEF domain-containing protein [Comamonadaceae bacterium]|nr:GGDEF domain-containing protein [Comamonadaceae bacterium]
MSVNAWLTLTVLSLLLAAMAFYLYWRERKHRLVLAAKLELATRKIESNLIFDDLTGLLSRVGFNAVVDKAIAQVEVGGGNFCVIYVALDNFGLLNDAFGQTSGDSLLRTVSKRLATCAGPKAEVCRITSGEFALIVGGDMGYGRSIAVRVTEVLSEPLKFDATHTVLSCSIGIAEYPTHGARAKLLANAALAMRSVKVNGGGDYCQYDPKMGVEVRDEALLINDLRRALDAGQLELYFQPKVDAFSLQVTAAEALLRWHHPTRGFVSPVVFIPLAERYGLIGAIGDWVIEEACLKAAGWRERGLRMRVAVNISGYQMREDDLVERIEAALQRNNLQPGRFTCEITESVAMEDTKVTQATFEKMRQAGFHVSIDDFGTGFSSLAMLRRLPAAELKIDRAFVTDLEDREDARSIAQSIVNMAKALNLHVVAEGVETQGQCNLLVEMGCHELQGFLFSKPIRAEDLEWLALDNKRQDVQFRPSLFMDTMDANL